MTTHDDRTIRAETVIAEVDARWGSACGGCAVPLVGHDIVLSMLMGQRAAPRCVSCLAASVADERAPFLQRAHANVRRLACYRAGWEHSDARLAAADATWPEERVPAALRLDGVPEPAASEAPRGTRGEAPDAGAPAARSEFDAGDMGCGDLVLELRARLLQLAPGEVLMVRATDPGAPGDLPAWCRVTGNPLLHHAHPAYWIQRRRDAGPAR